MGHYDKCYEAEAEKEKIRRDEIRKQLQTKVTEMRKSISSNRYEFAVPQRFQDSLEDFYNWLDF